MSAACSTCGCSTPVLPSGRCIICEGAFRAGQRIEYEPPRWSYGPGLTSVETDS